MAAHPKESYMETVMLNSEHEIIISLHRRINTACASEEVGTAIQDGLWELGIRGNAEEVEFITGKMPKLAEAIAENLLQSPGRRVCWMALMHFLHSPGGKSLPQDLLEARIAKNLLAQLSKTDTDLVAMLPTSGVQARIDELLDDIHETPDFSNALEPAVRNGIFDLTTAQWYVRRHCDTAACDLTQATFPGEPRG